MRLIIKFNGDERRKCKEIFTREFFWAIAPVCVLSTLFCATASSILVSLEKPTRDGLMAESGPVEMGTVVLYGLISLTLIIMGLAQWFGRSTVPASNRVPGPRYPFLLAFFVAVFAARELDFHSRWTTKDVFKTSFYVSPDVSLTELGLVLLVLGTIIAATLLVIYRYLPMVMERCRFGQIDGILPLSGLLLVLFSKSLDSGTGTLRRSGFNLNENSRIFIGGMEEFSELLIPLFFAAMLVRSIAVQPPVYEQTTPSLIPESVPKRRAA